MIMGFQEYNAKLSDFGLAKEGPSGNNTHVSTQVLGTHGYAAPEYVATGWHIIHSTNKHFTPFCFLFQENQSYFILPPVLNIRPN